MPTNNPCDNCQARKAYDAEVAKEAQARLKRIMKVGERYGDGDGKAENNKTATANPDPDTKRVIKQGNSPGVRY